MGNLLVCFYLEVVYFVWMKVKEYKGLCKKNVLKGSIYYL